MLPEHGRHYIRFFFFVHVSEEGIIIVRSERMLTKVVLGFVVFTAVVMGSSVL
jgi:hypothetical protein